MDLLHDPDCCPRILIIDDSDMDRRLLRLRLRDEAVELFEAVDGRTGLALCRQQPPDLILLDLRLPDWNGFEVLRRLKEDPELYGIPVIFLSATGRTEEKAKGLDLGAVDYITKPFDPVELKARVRAALRTKRLQDLLEQRAHLDGLTGLANRHSLDDHLRREWVRCQRANQWISVILVDLDRFKQVNDTYGHSAGDEVLRVAGRILRDSIREGDFPARYGGEEFIVVAVDCDALGAWEIAERFRRELAARPVGLSERVRIPITASLGIAVQLPDASGAHDLIELADRALYHAKQNGRNRTCRWDPDREVISDASPRTPARMEPLRVVNF